MSLNKLKKFAAIKTFDNVLEHPKDMAGQWNNFFKNDHPIVLELACGKGEYTVGLAKLFPHKNFIGVDLKGNRLYTGAKICIEENLKNAAFLRAQIEQIHTYFSLNEIDEIWITFADPQLNTSASKKRLTHPKFLRNYLNILKPNGLINLKTDSPQLYEFTLKLKDWSGINIHFASDNIYAEPNQKTEWQIKTYYEGLNIAKSKSIHYIQFSLPQKIEDNDKALQEKLKNEEKRLSNK